jgi:hypothetical protein
MTMEELIERVAQAAGIEAGTARQAVAQILAFLQKEGPADTVNEVMEKLPGASELAATATDGGSGGLMGALGGMMGGGGLMALAGKLGALGLGMGEMQTVGREVLGYAREKAGEEKVGEIAGAIPGLSQLL